jgi:hypothetical protein
MSSGRLVNRRRFASGLGVTVAGAVLLVALEELARAQAADVVVLLNARNPTSSLSRDEACKFLFGQTAFWHGIVPVKLCKSRASRMSR